MVRGDGSWVRENRSCGLEERVGVIVGCLVVLGRGRKVMDYGFLMDGRMERLEGTSWQKRLNLFHDVRRVI